MIEIKSQTILNAIKHKSEIRWQTHENGATVVAYMIANSNTFDDKLSRECRGITFFDEKVVGRPLHKFFNVNEKPETQLASIDWSRVVRIMDKRDGSMINTVAIPSKNHNFSIKSKKTFSSKFAEVSMEWISAHPSYVDLCTRCAAHDLTAIFEWTAPDNRIVINYKTAELQLLHIRENVSGRYFSQAELECFAKGCTIVKSYQIASIQDILMSAETANDIEGWVFQFDDGDMVKLKTKWYLDRHYAMTALRDRDVAELVLIEAIDDLKSKLVTSGVDITPILAIEERVVSTINNIAQDVNTLANSCKDLSKKDAAAKYKNHKYFGLIMAQLNSKTPDIKKYVMNNLLKLDYDLKSVYE